MLFLVESCFALATIAVVGIGRPLFITSILGLLQYAVTNTSSGQRNVHCSGPTEHTGFCFCCWIFSNNFLFATIPGTRSIRDTRPIAGAIISGRCSTINCNTSGGNISNDIGILGDIDEEEDAEETVVVVAVPCCCRGGGGADNTRISRRPSPFRVDPFIPSDTADDDDTAPSAIFVGTDLEEEEESFLLCEYIHSNLCIQSLCCRSFSSYTQFNTLIYIYYVYICVSAGLIYIYIYIVSQNTYHGRVV